MSFLWEHRGKKVFLLSGSWHLHWTIPTPFLTDNVLIVQDRTDERSRYLQSQQHTPKKGQEAWWGECTQTTCRFSKLRDYQERKWLLRSPLTFLDWIWETTATSYFMLWAENLFITAALKNLPATTLFTFKLVEHLMSRQKAGSTIAVHQILSSCLNNQTSGTHQGENATLKKWSQMKNILLH